MAINKKLIHFKSKQKFNEELAKGNILDTSIVFIQETTEIYTHGTLYDGSTFDPSDIETSISNKVDKVDGKQLSTEDFTSTLKTKLEGLNNYDDTELSETLITLREDFDKLVSGDTTTAIKTFNEIVAFLDGINDTEDLSSIIASIEQQIADKMDKVTLATVATSGSYNDLTNKPTIPVAVTESTVSGWGFTKNKGTYSKPSTGIPKTDLASAIQASLDKADNAFSGSINGFKEGNFWLTSGIKINGETKTPNSEGVIDLGAIGGNSSNANVQAIDTGDNIDDISVDYATKTYVDELVGNINDILISIIGESNEYSITYNTNCLELATMLYDKYGSSQNTISIDEHIKIYDFPTLGDDVGIIAYSGNEYAVNLYTDNSIYCVRISLDESNPYYGIATEFMYD